MMVVAGCEAGGGPSGGGGGNPPTGDGGGGGGNGQNRAPCVKCATIQKNHSNS